MIRLKSHPQIWELTKESSLTFELYSSCQFLMILFQQRSNKQTHYLLKVALSIVFSVGLPFTLRFPVIIVESMPSPISLTLYLCFGITIYSAYIPFLRCIVYDSLDLLGAESTASMIRTKSPLPSCDTTTSRPTTRRGRETKIKGRRRMRNIVIVKNWNMLLDRLSDISLVSSGIVVHQCMLQLSNSSKKTPNNNCTPNVALNYVLNYLAFFFRVAICVGCM